MWKRNESLDEDSAGFVGEAEREGFSLESGNLEFARRPRTVASSLREITVFTRIRFRFR